MGLLVTSKPNKNNTSKPVNNTSIFQNLSFKRNNNQKEREEYLIKILHNLTNSDENVKNLMNLAENNKKDTIEKMIHAFEPFYIANTKNYERPGAKAVYNIWVGNSGKFSMRMHTLYHEFEFKPEMNNEYIESISVTCEVLRDLYGEILGKCKITTTFDLHNDVNSIVYLDYNGKYINIPGVSIPEQSNDKISYPYGIDFELYRNTKCKCKFNKAWYYHLIKQLQSDIEDGVVDFTFFLNYGEALYRLVEDGVRTIKYYERSVNTLYTFKQAIIGLAGYEKKYETETSSPSKVTLSDAEKRSKDLKTVNDVLSCLVNMNENWGAMERSIYGDDSVQGMMHNSTYFE